MPTTILEETVSPAPRSYRQVTVPLLSEHSGDAETKSTPIGKTSVTTTPSASEFPVFCTSNV